MHFIALFLAILAEFRLQSIPGPGGGVDIVSPTKYHANPTNNYKTAKNGLH